MNLTPIYNASRRFVLHHPEAGIYLGNFLGMGFWSHLDPVGQPQAVTFATETEALTHIQSWDETNSDFNTNITIRPVNTAGAETTRPLIRSIHLHHLCS
jgi:hypothetical protein